jgi:alkyl sulfatase BDS1-like metallo-beta-lactamase superfamily hydrolase
VEGKKYVEFMGGADAVLTKAKQSYDKGDYRWVAQVVHHVVFADPSNQAAKNLEADALEQLGYQAESGPWRNFYLTGAKQCRNDKCCPPHRCDLVYHFLIAVWRAKAAEFAAVK